jgi:hypothetical protein
MSVMACIYRATLMPNNGFQRTVLALARGSQQLSSGVEAVEKVKIQL